MDSFESRPTPPRRGRGRPRRDPAIPPHDPGVLQGPEAESFSRAILNSLPAHLAVIEQDGRVVGVNKAWDKFVNEVADRFPKVAGLGDNYLDRLADGHSFEGPASSLALAGLHEVLDRKRARFELEYPMHFGDDRRWFHLTATPLLGAEGGAVISHLETTDRKRAENAVGDLAEVFRAVIDSTADGVVVSDEAGEFLFYNRAARELAGVGLIESDPSTWSEKYGLFYSDWTTRFRNEELPLVRAIKGETTDAVRLYLKNEHVPDGRVFTASGRPWRTPGGERSGGVVVFRDVSQDVIAEEQSRLQINVLDAIPSAVLALDHDGRVLYWNRAAEELCGWPAVEIVGRRGRDVLLSEEERTQVDGIREYVLSGGFFRGEFRVRRPDGTRVPVLASASAIRRPDGSPGGFVVVGVDLSDVKMTQDALRVREYELRQFQKMEAIGRLAGGVAHDFNNLLTVIKGYADILVSRLPPGTSGHGEVLEMAQAAERAAQLTGQLMAFGRRQSLDPVLLNLNGVISDFTPMLRRTLGEDLALSVVLDPDLGQTLADSVQIGQVLLNLVLNARDAMPNGGHITIETRNASLDAGFPGTHVPLEPGAYVQLSVSDTGIGMDEEIRSRVFEPFFTTKDPGRGTGLGLSTAYGIVRQLGGNIWVYSEPGRGTTFKIYLPRVFEPQAPPPRLTPPADARGAETILIVEDEPDVRTVERRLLEARGYRVLEAEGYDSALGIARSHKGRIALVLADVILPGRSGRQVVEALQNTLPDLRVLYVSGHSSDIIVKRGELDPGLPFLQKPFSSAELADAIRRALDAPADKSASH
ncbi:MAG: PAS domain-containing protein [Candidatus Eiseniibacteriota bacterium]